MKSEIGIFITLFRSILRDPSLLHTAEGCWGHETRQLSVMNVGEADFRARRESRAKRKRTKRNADEILSLEYIKLRYPSYVYLQQDAMDCMPYPTTSFA